MNDRRDSSGRRPAAAGFFTPFARKRRRTLWGAAITAIVVAVGALTAGPAYAAAQLSVQSLAEANGNCGSNAAHTDRGNCETSINSTVEQQFAVSASALDPGQTIKNVIATFTFAPSGGAQLSMPALPSSCQTVNVSPVSSTSGNLTLTCNLGDVSSAQIIAVDTNVIATGGSPNGSSFQTSVQVTAGDGTVAPSNTVTNPVITIQGTPSYQTDKSVAGGPTFGTYTVNGTQQRGYQVVYNIYGKPETSASTDLAVPLSISDTLAQFPNAMITSCAGPSQYGGANVTPVASCPTGSAGGGWDLTFNNLQNGTYGQSVAVFISEADANKAVDPNWAAGDPTPNGSVAFDNCVAAPGKTDSRGQLNNGDGHMDGQLCANATITTGTANGPKPVGFKKTVRDGVDTDNGDFTFPDQHLAGAHLYYVNNGLTADTNAYLCDAFDVSTMQLKGSNSVTFDAIGGTNVSAPAGYEVEYAVAANTSNDQVGTATAQNGYTVPVYDNSSPDQLANATACSTSAGPWSTDPTTFGANWQDKVNLVRLVPIPGYTPTPSMAPNASVNMWLNFTVRSVYNGGPHAGETIPDGAYVANVGSWDAYDSAGVLGVQTQTAHIAFNQHTLTTTTGVKSYLQDGVGQGAGYLITPGRTGVMSAVTYQNTGSFPDTHAYVCDAWDVSVLKMSSWQINVDSVVPLGAGYGQGGHFMVAPPGYEIEYAAGPNTTNDEVGAPAVGNGYTIPVYGYSAPDQQANAQSCSTYAGPWTTDPTATYGANWGDSVNMLRLVPIPGYTPTPYLPAGARVNLIIYFDAVRSAYNGGPHAGQTIKTGAMIPNYGAWDQISNGVISDGLQSAAAAFRAVTLSVSKTYDTTVNYQPGAQLKWTMHPAITAGIAGQKTTGLTVSDPLPAGYDYDAGCTAASLPAGVRASYDGSTRTVTFTYSQSFTISDTLPQALPDVTVCGNVLSTVSPGRTLMNTASVTANESPLPASGSSSVLVAGPGMLGISKQVDKPVIAQGDTYTWTLTWADTSSVSFGKPQIIDVFPYNGDGTTTATSKRNAGSSVFSGTNTLNGALAQPTFNPGSTSSGAVAGTWYYTTVSPASIDQNPGAASNASPGTGGSIWKTAAQITDFSTVTGVYFSSSADISAGDAVSASIPMTANATTDGDVYVNQAELYSPSTPNNPVVSNDAFTQIPGAIHIVKEASTARVGRVGETVTYTFTVSNPGAAPLHDVTVTDTLTAPSDPGDLSEIDCQSLSNPAGTCSGTTTSLLSGQTATFTATYTVTQADLDNGTINDSAVANGDAGQNGQSIAVQSDPSAAVVEARPVPALTVEKSAAPTTVSQAGSTVTYTFVATNTGDLPLSNVHIADTQVAPALASGMSAIVCASLASPAGTCSGLATDLAVGQSATFTGTYTVTQADVDNGVINDHAVAQGSTADATDVESEPSSAIVQTILSPSLSVEKATTTSVATIVGQEIPYTFTVANIGNVTVVGLAVTDTVAAPSQQSGLSAVTCPVDTLAPGDSTVCTATYSVTQADLDNRVLADTAVARGHTPNGTPVESNESTVTVPGVSPALNLPLVSG
jgi:uncharacterized repeat protein (TIGR01451 family)